MSVAECVQCQVALDHGFGDPGLGTPPAGGGTGANDFLECLVKANLVFLLAKGFLKVSGKVYFGWTQYQAWIWRPPEDWVAGIEPWKDALLIGTDQAPG